MVASAFAPKPACSAGAAAATGAITGYGVPAILFRKRLELDIIKWYRYLMHGKHRKTLAAIFDDPVRANVLWTDVESLFIAVGAAVSEGRGSRVRVSLNGVDAVFHRPHPEKETDKGALKSVRRFLREAGVTP
jgi:hypothetical protein